MKKILFLLFMMMHYQSSMIASSALESKKDSDYESLSGYPSDNCDDYGDYYEYNSDDDLGYYEDYQINHQVLAAHAIDMFINRNELLFKKFEKIREQDSTKDTLKSYLEKYFNQYSNISDVNDDQVVQDALNYIDNCSQTAENNTKIYSDQGLISIDQYDGNHDHQFNEDDRATFTYIIENYPHFRNGFNLIYEHQLGPETSFGNFLKEAMTKDDYDVASIIFDAQKYIVNNMKDHFLSILQDSIVNNKKFKDIKSPIFWYCMSLKDNFISTYMNDWVRDQKDLLFFSVVNNNLDVAHLLLNLGLDPNYTHNSGKSLLIIAIINNAQNVFDQLLKQQNIKVNYQTEYGMTALIQAVIYNNIKIISTLLDTPGININLCTHTGLTSDTFIRKELSALFLAADKGYTEIVEMLLARPDIDVNLTDSITGETALIIASAKGHTKTIRKLLEHPDILLNVQDKEDLSAVMKAVKAGKTDTVRFLLKNHADLTLTDKKGRTVLHLLAQKNNKEMTDLLLQYYENLDCYARDNLGKTAYHLAVQANNLEFLTQFLESGYYYFQDERLTDNYGRTPVYYVKKLDVLKFLNGLGAISNINEMRDNEGLTPLHYAVSYDAPYEIIKFFLEFLSADVTIQDYNGLTASDHACNKEVKKILQDKNLTTKLKYSI